MLISSPTKVKRLLFWTVLTPKGRDLNYLARGCWLEKLREKKIDPNSYSKWDFLILDRVERCLFLPTLGPVFDFLPDPGETGCLDGLAAWTQELSSKPQPLGL